VTRAGLLKLIEAHASKVGVHSAIEATRIATDRKERVPRDSEVVLRAEIADLREQIKAAVNALPIE